MVENILIFALGFLMAGLLSLLFLPAFWRRAIRLSTQRLELRMPLSMSEIVAARDQLRAEFAAERRKLEQSSEQLAAQLAENRATLGERSTAIAELESKLDVTARDAANAHEKLELYERQLNETDLERVAFEKLHFDTYKDLERRSNELSALKDEHQNLQQVADEQRMTLAGLVTQVSGLEMELDISQDNLRRTTKERDEKISSAQFLERERDQFRADVAAARTRREQLQESIAALQARVEKLDGSLRVAHRNQNRTASDLEKAQSDLLAAQAREAKLKIELSGRTDALKNTEKEIAMQVEAKKSQETALEGALAAARQDNQNLRSELNDLRRKLSQTAGAHAALQAAAASGKVASLPIVSGEADTLPDLRKAIADIGTDIVEIASVLEKTMDRDGKGKKRPASDLPEKMRELRDAVRASGGSNQSVI